MSASSSSALATRERVHPSMLPENQYRTILHQVFHSQLIPQVSSLLGKGSCIDPPPEFERAWRIFLGINISGKLHFVCHVAEHFVTAQAYNCQDTDVKECPVLLYGEPFHVKKDVMNQIRGLFPNHHQGKVPFQMALTVVPKLSPNDPDPSKTLLDLLNRNIDHLDTHDFTINLMHPHGEQSLSFNIPDFPTQIWTHQSRYQVIFTALEKEKKKVDPDPNVITLYQKACQLENAFSQAKKNLKDLEIKRDSLQQNLQKEQNRLGNLVKNAHIPKGKKAEAIEKKQDQIDKLSNEKKSLETEIGPVVQQVIQASQDIDDFKATHKEKLPNSYREATFQLAFETTLPSGVSVYKQYNGETGKFESSENPDTVRYLNAVHTPYLDLPI